MKRVIVRERLVYVPDHIDVADAMPLIQKACSHADVQVQIWEAADTEIANINKAGQYKIKWMGGHISIYISPDADLIPRDAAAKKEEDKWQFKPLLAIFVCESGSGYPAEDIGVWFSNASMPVPASETDVAYWKKTEDEGGEIPGYGHLYREEGIPGDTGLVTHSYDYFFAPVAGKQTIYSPILPAETTYSYDLPEGSMWFWEFAWRNCYNPSIGGFEQVMPIIYGGPGMKFIEEPPPYYCTATTSGWKIYSGQDLATSWITEIPTEIRDGGTILREGLYKTDYRKNYVLYYKNADMTFMIWYLSRFSGYEDWLDRLTRPLPNYDIYRQYNSEEELPPGVNPIGVWGPGISPLYGKPPATLVTLEDTSVSLKGGSSWAEAKGGTYRAYVWTEQRWGDVSLYLTAGETTWEFTPTCKNWLAIAPSCLVHDFFGTPVVSFSILYADTDAKEVFCIYGMVWNDEIYQLGPYEMQRTEYNDSVNRWTPAGNFPGETYGATSIIILAEQKINLGDGDPYVDDYYYPIDRD